MSEIFKIQLPLDNNLNDPPALVYNKDRSIECYVPVKSVSNLFDEEETKIYAQGTIVNEQFQYEHRVVDQPW